MVLSELIKDVRYLVNDDSSTAYRWGNVKILGFLKDAIVVLNSIRPESRYIKGQLTDIEFGNDLANFEIPSEYARWHEGFVYYAGGKCLEEDATDTSNATLAADFMTKASSRFQA